MKKLSLYGIISVASILIRQFLLPNPFECFGDKGILYNWMAEPFIHIIAFTLVGFVYRRGSFPALGSFLYLLAYSAIVGFLYLLGIFSFAWWWILIVVVIAIGIIIGIIIVWNKIITNSDYN